jgi:perosamine synthetase
MSEIDVSEKTAAMTCAQGDVLFAGLEKALDNGRGFVFVTDAAGKLPAMPTLR